MPVETGMPDLCGIDLGDIDRLDRALLANARRVVIEGIESPDLAVARFDPGRDAHDTTRGPSPESAHVRADCDADEYD